jgi:RNA polymerase sigma-70 factor (family 1)
MKSDCTEFDEKELVAELRSSDSKKAFEVIYRHYVNQLHSFARRNINDQAACEEIIQDVFESLWTRRESLNITSLRHYLYSSVRYKIIRYFQHNAVKKKYADHFRFFETVYDSIEANEQPDPDQLLQKLDHYIEALPERCRIAFRFRMHENLSNGQIAERMNIGKKTVELYMFKAFAHIRATCKQELNTR